MTSLPIDIVNCICEFAQDNTHLWRPFFSPKTGLVSWKVNPYCTNYIKLSRHFINAVNWGVLSLLDCWTMEERLVPCRILVFYPENDEWHKRKLYVEFCMDNDASFVFRAMMTIVNHYAVPDKHSLYVNATEYATIECGYIPSMDQPSHCVNRLVLMYKKY